MNALGSIIGGLKFLKIGKFCYLFYFFEFVIATGPVIVVFVIRYHGDWRTETQTVVSLVALMHWLETGSLLLHTEAEEQLGCMFYSMFFNSQ